MKQSDLSREAIWKLLNNGKSWAEIGAKFGTTKEAVRSHYRRLKKKAVAAGDELPGVFDDDEDSPELDAQYESEAASIIFEDIKRTENIDWRELLEVATTNQDINERLGDDQRIATVRIDTKKPVAIIYTGDWHLGDQSTDYASWKKLMELVLGNDNVFMVDLGDDIQNMRVFKTLSAIFAQVLSPEQQAYLMKSVILELTRKNKLLAKVGGNHDEEFDERIFAQSLQKYLLANMHAPHFRNRGLLKMQVGEQTYTSLLFHKSRFRSFMRTTHGNYREYTLSYPADIVAGAHDHVPGFETMYHYNLARDAGMGFGGETFLIKVGTYQDSDFGWRYFHNGGQCNPTVVLFPDQHKKVAFMNPEDALRYIGTFK